MEQVRVEARGIELAYGATKVLRGISFNVEPGEFFALLGPSGSGKSTLLRLIAGFNQHQAGRLLIGDRDVTGIPPWQRNVGMVFQNYALWPHMTVRANVAFGLEERRLPKDEIRRRADAALALVGLADYAGRRPGELSGGQQQRVALARTLAVEPQVLLLDEPLSNLDAKLRVQMRQELRRLHERLGITTIFVTHDQEEALTICDRVAVMDQGVIQQIGTPVALFDQPVNRFVAQFVGSVNLYEGEFRDAKFVSPTLGEVLVPSSIASGAPRVASLAFRPHAVQFDAAERRTGDDSLRLEGRIAGSEFLGEFMRYEIRVNDAIVTADQPHARGTDRLAVGTALSLSVPARELRVIASA